MNARGEPTRPDEEALEKRALELAETTDLPPKQARELILRCGDDREALLEAARTFKAEG